MKKCLIIATIMICLSFSAFAAMSNYSISAGLGITPSLGFSADYDVFEFNLEARALGAHVEVDADFLRSERHDLDFGFGIGVNKNLLVDMFSALLTLGQAQDLWYCSFDLMVRYTFHINEHNSLFIGTGIPLCMAELSEDSFSPKFYLAEQDGLKRTGENALLYNTKIGYRYTF